MTRIGNGGGKNSGKSSGYNGSTGQTQSASKARRVEHFRCQMQPPWLSGSATPYRDRDRDRDRVAFPGTKHL